VPAFAGDGIGRVVVGDDDRTVELIGLNAYQSRFQIGQLHVADFGERPTLAGDHAGVLQ
jgi:hypothetical protein